MINQSRTINDAYRKQFPDWDNYQALLERISKGYLGSEPSARKMAKEHGFPITQLEKALKEGIQTSYGHSLLERISKGYLGSEPSARKMAKEHGFPITQLEKALEI